jgi:hypothetical protein
VVPEVTGGAGAGGLEGLTGVTFGYMKWCERIYPKDVPTARFLTRANRDVRHGGADTCRRGATNRYLCFGTQVRYLRVPWMTRLEAVVATIFTV